MTEVNSALKYKNGICEFGIEKKIIHCKRLQNSPATQTLLAREPGGAIATTPESLCFVVQKGVQKLDM